jgi:phage-related protein
MDLFVKVAYDDSDVDKGIEGTSKKGSSFAKGLGTAFRTVAVGVGAIAGAAGAGAIALGRAVISSFGELEQNLGGAEAVFGAYADSIVSSSADAYKKIGLSQSEYLATANKMGALFQGSGLDQQKSLEMTTAAMQRAADMASVMGIDGKAAMDAVTGAAKGNYTMMDNLGVAMNDTSLKSYALAKGLDVTWESATQAQKAEIAMQMFLENTAQYAGNFEREATQTISGSLGMLKASISDFVAGMGDADADTAQLAGNIVSSFEAVVKNVTPVLKNIVKAIPPALSALVGAIGGMLPELLSSVSGLFGSVLTTIIGLLPTLVPAAAGAITTIINTLIENLPLLIEAALTILSTLALGIAEQAPTLIPAIVQTMLTIMNTLVNNIPLLVNAAIQLMMGLAKGLIAAIPLLTRQIPTIIINLIDAITDNAPMLIQASFDIMVALASGLIKAIPQLIKAIPQIMAALFKAFSAVTSQLSSIGRNIVSGIWSGISGGMSWILGKIRGWVGSVLSYIKRLFGIKSPSTVMREEVGKMLSYGLGDGILKYAGYAQGAMASLMNGIMGETYNPVINPTVNGSTGMYGAALAGAGGVSGVSIGQVNFNQPLQSTTQAAKLFGRKLAGELYA